MTTAASRLSPSSAGSPPAADLAGARHTAETIRAHSGASREDLALVKRLLDGDEAAFGDLVEQYHGRLVRLAQVFVADRATAEEVVQDTWLAVLTGLGSFEGRSSLKTWMFSILTNRAKTRGQRDKRLVPFSALSDRHSQDEPAVTPSRFTALGSWSAPPERWDEDTPERLLLQHETRALIDQAIAGLPAGQRAVVSLRDVEELDSADVCHILKIGEGNQRVQLHRARAKIRAVLEEHLRRRQRSSI